MSIDVAIAALVSSNMPILQEVGITFRMWEVVDTLMNQVRIQFGRASHVWEHLLAMRCLVLVVFSL